MSLVSACCLKPPSLAGNHPGTCPLCERGLMDMSEHKSDFSIQEATNDLNRPHKGSNIHWPLKIFRYCWIHRIARLLCFILTNLRNAIRKRKFAEFLARFMDLLFFQGRQSSVETISAFKTKQFLESNETLLEASMLWCGAEIHSPSTCQRTSGELFQ